MSGRNHNHATKLTNAEWTRWGFAYDVGYAEALARGLDPENAAIFAADGADQCIKQRRERMQWRRPA